MITEKTCTGPCGKTLSVDEFHWKSKRRGTRQAKCKACMADYGHAHYVANADTYKERANNRLKELRANNRNMVKSYMATNPCFTCQEDNPKMLTISIDSVKVNNLSSADLLTELEPNLVICRNCLASKD